VSKFEVQLDAGLDLRITRVLQPVTAEEIGEFANAQAEIRLYQNLIWDFAPGALQLLTTDDLKRLLSNRLDRVRKRVGGQTVMIARNDSEFTLMKWYKQFAESLDVPEVRFHIARDLDEALEIIAAG